MLVARPLTRWCWENKQTHRTVDRFLDDLQERYGCVAPECFLVLPQTSLSPCTSSTVAAPLGARWIHCPATLVCSGIDAVLLWQGYPNLGADDQNNFDMLRNLPGGIEGLREMVAAFHARDVKVLWPNFVWDTQTRVEGGSSAWQAEALTALVVETG